MEEENGVGTIEFHHNVWLDEKDHFQIVLK